MNNIGLLFKKFENEKGEGEKLMFFSEQNIDEELRDRLKKGVKNTPFYFKNNNIKLLIFKLEEYNKINFENKYVLKDLERYHFIYYLIQAFKDAGVKVYSNTDNIPEIVTVYNTFKLDVPYIEKNNEIYAENYKLLLYPYENVISQSIFSKKNSYEINIKQTDTSIVCKDFINEFSIYFQEIEMTQKEWLLMFPYQFLSCQHTQYNFENKFKEDNLIIPLVSYEELSPTNVMIYNELSYLFDLEEPKICSLNYLVKDHLEYDQENDNYYFNEDQLYTYIPNTLNALLRKKYNISYFFEYDTSKLIPMTKKLKKSNNIINADGINFQDSNNYEILQKRIGKIDLFTYDQPNILIEKNNGIFRMGNMGYLGSEFFFLKIYSAFMYGLASLKKNGSIVSFFYSDHPIYMEFICVLQNYFESIKLVKHPVSIYYKSNHNIVCEGFKGISEKELNGLVSVWKQLEKLDKKNQFMDDTPLEELKSLYSMKKYYSSIFKVPKEQYAKVEKICMKFQKEIYQNQLYKYERVNDIMYIIENSDERKKRKILRYIRESQIQIAIDCCKKYKIPIAPYYRERYKHEMIFTMPEKNDKTIAEA